MSGASESTRGIRTLPDEGTELTAAELAWVQGQTMAGTPVENETPSGAIDGANKTFTLAYTPIANSVKLYMNAIRMMLNSDFTVVGATITLLGDAPEVGMNLLCDYRR